MSDPHPIDEKIRAIVLCHGRLSTAATALPPHADLFEAGMSSHASVDVMLALEEAFDVEFPDELLTRQVFGSIAALREALLRIGVQ